MFFFVYLRTHADGDEIDFLRLQDRGNRISCYISVGTLEHGRADKDDFPAEAVGDEYGDWGENFIDINHAVRLVYVFGERSLVFVLGGT